MIYEFEIHNRQTQETKYLCFETDTLENAEVCLEKDVSIDQEHSTYELNRVISFHQLFILHMKNLLFVINKH